MVFLLFVPEVERKSGESSRPDNFETKELYVFKDKKSSQQEHGEFKVSKWVA